MEEIFQKIEDNFNETQEEENKDQKYKDQNEETTTDSSQL